MFNDSNDVLELRRNFICDSDESYALDPLTWTSKVDSDSGSHPDRFLHSYLAMAGRPREDHMIVSLVHMMEEADKGFATMVFSHLENCRRGLEYFNVTALSLSDAYAQFCS
ncbi:MAG: hypothetical protein ACI83O_000979 [Patescibacteria group bacterium]|jgi:hypothetical protein